MKTSYKTTTFACMSGIFVQAIVTNITAILFVPLKALYGLNFIDLGILVAINFLVQICIDIVLTPIIDRVNNKPLVMGAMIISGIGLILYAFTPLIFDNIFVGLIIATIVFAAASGGCEVMLSPIINNLPDDGSGKAGAMSLMHSFYAWGQVATIIITSLFIFIFGSNSWQIIVLIWAVIPFITFALFIFSRIERYVTEKTMTKFSHVIFKPFCIVCLLAIMFGAATEVTMNQWISTFSEVGLKMPKLMGDMFGMCLFAVCMGLGRMLYGIFGKKISVSKMTLYGSLLAIICYVGCALSPYPALSVIFGVITGFASSLLWPGTLIIASEKYPMAGSYLFAMLAIFGDVGAGGAPLITGAIVDAFSNAQTGLRAGLLVAAIFPVLAFLCHLYLIKRKKKG